MMTPVNESNPQAEAQLKSQAKTTTETEHGVHVEHHQTKRVEPSAEIIFTVNQLMQSGFEIPEEKLVASAGLKELGLDSLDAVDMLVYIEEKMGVRIEGERLRSVKTLHDVYVLAAESIERASQPSVPPSKLEPTIKSVTEGKLESASELNVKT